ncbi:MAG TPA: hypothetical protein VNO26_05505 [Candidatus Limnocylindria bacterium]|nr:hypothetical protein [Candidatus Limnocylindria bacterium]
MAEFAAKLARGVTVRADLGVNAATGVAVVGANATMTEGTTLYANRVKIAPGAEVDDVRTNALNAADTNSINGTVDPVALPLKVPYCPMPELSCGTGDMQVTDTTTELAPGSYGKVNVGTGAILHLPGNGHYQFCELRIANGGQVLVTHQVTIDVTGNVIVGTRSSFRTGGGAPFTLRVGGSKVLLGREALVTAAITAPNAKGKVKADSTLAGCMCARVLKAAKNAQLTCAGDSGEGSPSGAFTD